MAELVGIYQHTWTDVNWTGPCFFLLKHGLATILGFIGY